MRDRAALSHLFESADDGMLSPFEPEAVVPAQLFTARERWRARNAEQRLMLAILEDAVAVYCNHREPATARRRRTFKSARDWLASDDRAWTFSFVRICEELDLDPERVRRGIALRQEARQARVQARTEQERMRREQGDWGWECDPTRLS